MSWYVHPSRQLRDDELPPELIVINRDGSIEQVYVPYDATGEQLKAENAELRERLGAYERVIAEIAQDRDKASELFDKCADECERVAWIERKDACSYHLELFRDAGWED